MKRKKINAVSDNNYVIARRDWFCRNVAIRWKATLLAMALPRDCHVKRKSRFPRNDIKCAFSTLDLLHTDIILTP